MKAFQLTILMLVGAVLSENCKHGAVQRDPNDCAGYLVCKYGNFVQFKCKEGLLWNDIDKICDFPIHSSCSKGLQGVDSEAMEDASDSKEDNRAKVTEENSAGAYWSSKEDLTTASSKTDQNFDAPEDNTRSVDDIYVHDPPGNKSDYKSESYEASTRNGDLYCNDSNCDEDVTIFTPHNAKESYNYHITATTPSSGDRSSAAFHLNEDALTFPPDEEYDYYDSEVGPIRLPIPIEGTLDPENSVVDEYPVMFPLREHFYYDEESRWNEDRQNSADFPPTTTPKVTNFQIGSEDVSIYMFNSSAEEVGVPDAEESESGEDFVTSTRREEVSGAVNAIDVATVPVDVDFNSEDDFEHDLLGSSSGSGSGSGSGNGQECISGERISNPGDCNSYKQCILGGYHVIPCPHGSHWNDDIHECDLPEKAKCPWTIPATGVTTCTEFRYYGDVYDPHLEHDYNEESDEFLGSGSGSRSGYDEECVHGDRISNPGDCNSYRQCIFGAYHVILCPHGSHWNDDIHECDLPEKAKCPWTTLASGTTVSNEFSYYGGVYDPYLEQEYNEQSGDFVFDDFLGSGSGYGEGCVHGNVIPNPGDCDSFRQCFRGVYHIIHCPPGSHWNNESHECDLPKIAKCPWAHEEVSEREGLMDSEDYISKNDFYYEEEGDNLGAGS